MVKLRTDKIEVNALHFENKKQKYRLPKFVFDNNARFLR